jgi:hypothetical protein
MHPGFVRDVRRRHAVGRAPLDHFHDGVNFGIEQAGVEERVERVERQVQGMQHEVRGFIECIR